jgi:hypothetical protein
VRGFLYALRLRGIPVTQLAVREGWNTWYLRRGCTPTLFRYLEVHSSTNMSSCLLTSSSPWSCVSPCIMAKHVINRDGCLCPLINHQQHHHYHLSMYLHTRNPEHRYKTSGHFLHGFYPRSPTLSPAAQNLDHGVHTLNQSTASSIVVLSLVVFVSFRTSNKVFRSSRFSYFLLPTPKGYSTIKRTIFFLPGAVGFIKACVVILPFSSTCLRCQNRASELRACDIYKLTTS